jgi:hypothetical protein
MIIILQALQACMKITNTFFLTYVSLYNEVRCCKSNFYQLREISFYYLTTLVRMRTKEKVGNKWLNETANILCRMRSSFCRRF